VLAHAILLGSVKTQSSEFGQTTWVRTAS